jgi:ribosome-associated translation inhibitor RaiA
MKASSAISLHNVPSHAEVIIRDQIDRLAQDHKWILNCQVTAEVPLPYTEGLYQIQITLTLPERLLIVDRLPCTDHYHEDIYVAIWSAFDLARQQIRDYLMKPSSHTSSHRRQLQYS